MYTSCEQCPYLANLSRYNSNIKYDVCDPYLCSYYSNTPMYYSDLPNQFHTRYIPFENIMDCDLRFDFMNSSPSDSSIELKDYGPNPFVVNINEATKQNDTFRTALWTGSHLQLTLMSINVGDDIGLEIHPHLDQFIRIEEGQGLVKMGDSKNNLDFQRNVYDDFAFIIPAGKWHNLINIGNTPLKLYSIYAPPQHPFGTVHETKADAQAAEESLNHRQTKEFTLSELAQYDGTAGKPAYVAVNGIVYDVTNNSKWSGAVHYGLTAGKDLTSQFESCHGVASKLAKLPKVGILKV